MRCSSRFGWVQPAVGTGTSAEEEGLGTVRRNTESRSRAVVACGSTVLKPPSCQAVNTTGVTRAGAWQKRDSRPISKAVVLCGVEGHQCAFGKGGGLYQSICTLCTPWERYPLCLTGLCPSSVRCPSEVSTFPDNLGNACLLQVFLPDATGYRRHV